MSSDNAQSAVTYTSISSDSDGQSWGIPLMNASEFPEMDPYEVVAQQGQVRPLSPAYIPDPMELDEHAPSAVTYTSISSDSDRQSWGIPLMNAGSDETKPFKEDKIALTPPPSRHRGARISVRTQTPITASTQALIDAFASGSSPFPLPPTSPAYDQGQLGRRAAMIHRRDDILMEDMLPWRIFARYPGHDTQTIARAVDRAEDASYVRDLQASEPMIDRAIQKNSTHTQDDASQSSGEGLRRPVQPTHVCSYTDFMKCQPLNFKGTKGIVGLSQWLEKMESVFHISGYAIDNQVKFATC
nr:hypothetical protein [Tanacetum cinerariifolium]